jgi:excisionase family DNA binding protein
MQDYSQVAMKSTRILEAAMKHRTTHSGRRKHSATPRVRGSRLANPSFASVKEVEESQDEKKISSAPSCRMDTLGMPPVDLVNETVVATEKSAARLLKVGIVNAVPSNPAQRAVSSVDGKQVQQVRGEHRFEPLLDVAEAAMLLRMHPRTLRAKARKRLIPAIQVGRRWRFRASTLNDWLGKLAS